MNKFKVGDKVRCISVEPITNDVDPYELLNYFNIGSEGTVTSADKTGWIKVRDCQFWMCPDNWQLVEEKPEDQIEDFVVNAAKRKQKEHPRHLENIQAFKTTELNLPCESVTEITLKAEKGKTIVVKWI